MSKILLIKPRFLENFQLYSITQPLGIMYLAAILKELGHIPKIHDCICDFDNLYLLRQTLETWKPDFIGISIIITELEQTKKIMDLIRKTVPSDVPVIFGGPWPSANPVDAIHIFGADFVVQGEGEFVLPELINTINQKLDKQSLPGTASLVNGNVIVNPGRILSEKELDTIPFPAWELIDHTLYAKTSSMAGVGKRSYMSIMTSRGCPFKCAYCHRTMGKVFRKRSAASVLAELETLHFNHGFKEFEIIDDCFNLDRERFYKILIGIRDRIGRIKLHFPNAVRSDLLEPEDMALFKQAGTVSVAFAIETNTPRLQKMIHKNLNIEKAARVIDASVKAGIYSTGYFMIGFPTETCQEASSTIDFASNSSLHRAHFFCPIPYPGTELSEMAIDFQKSRGCIPDPEQWNFLSNSINISAMSDRELRMIFRQAYRRFYLNWKRGIRLLELLIKQPSIFPFKRIVKLFLINIFK